MIKNVTILMSQNQPDAVVTDHGKQLCTQITEELYGFTDDQYASPDKWAGIAERYGIRWNLTAGQRMVGGLPERYNGEPLVDGPHQYIIKIEHSTHTAPNNYMANHLETLIWKQAIEQSVTHLFAPVIGHGPEYRWLIMEEVETIGQNGTRKHGPIPYHDDWTEHNALKQEFKETFGEVPMKFGASPSSQIGIDQSGNIVAIDYAHCLTHIVGDSRIWAGTYDAINKRHISPAEANRRNSDTDTSSTSDETSTHSNTKQNRLYRWFLSLFP